MKMVLIINFIKPSVFIRVHLWFKSSSQHPPMAVFP